MKYLLLQISTLIFLVNFSIIAYGQVFSTIEVEFIKSTNKNNSEEVIKGHIYFNIDRLIVLTKEPLVQWMIIENDVMLIYYPNKDEAIKIKSQNPVNLPFLQTFLDLDQETVGLSKLGYLIDGNKMHGDTLSIYWNPPENAKKILGTYVQSFIDDKIIKTIIFDPNGMIIMQTTYNEFIFYHSQYFPLDIVMNSYSDSGNSSERIEYSNPVFNQPLPEDITNFVLPENVEVKEIEW